MKARQSVQITLNSQSLQIFIWSFVIFQSARKPVCSTLADKVVSETLPKCADKEGQFFMFPRVSMDNFLFRHVLCDVPSLIVLMLIEK